MRAAYDDAEILSSLRHINKYYLPLTGLVSTTLTGPADEDDDELPFAKAGFALGNNILVGAGMNQHVNVLGAIPENTDPIPVAYPIPFDYLSGTLVRKLVKVDCGLIEEGGIQIAASSTIPNAGAANAAGKVWLGEPDVGEFTASWGQRAHSLENVLSQYGIHEGRMKGTGTAEDPYRALVHPSNVGTQRDYAYELVATLNDGRLFRRFLLNPRPSISASGGWGAKNTPVVVQVGCQYTHKFDVITAS